MKEKIYQPQTVLVAFDEQAASNPSAREVIKAIINRSGDKPAPDEAERAYTEATATTNPNLSKEEADRIAGIRNRHAMLKEFRKARKNAPCNVCHRLIGNHSDKKLADCFEKMVAAKRREHLAKNKQAADAGSLYNE